MTMIMKSKNSAASHFLILLLAVVPPAVVNGFSGALFQEAVLQRQLPSKTAGIDIELPDFDELFDRIQQISPLARQVQSSNTHRGFAHMMDDNKGM
jgi:hypothetical protein